MWALSFQSWRDSEDSNLTRSPEPKAPTGPSGPVSRWKTSVHWDAGEMPSRAKVWQLVCWSL